MESIIQSHTIVLLVLNKMHPHLAFSLCSRLVLDPTTLIPFLLNCKEIQHDCEELAESKKGRGGGAALIGAIYFNRKELRKTWGGHVYSCQPNPETSGCRCLGVALPELRWSCVPHGCNCWGQWLRVPASRNGVCTKQGGLKTRGSDDQCEHRWVSAGRNFTIQCVGTFLKRLNLMQVRQVWVFVLLQGVGGLMQPDHGPSPAWPAWFAAVGQQTAPESQAGPWHPEPGQRCC